MSYYPYKTYYTYPFGDNEIHYIARETPPSASYCNNNSGWLLGLKPENLYCRMNYRAEISFNSPTAVSQSWSSSIVTTAGDGDCIQIGPLNGTFEAGRWEYSQSLKSNSSATGGTGSMLIFVWTGSNSNGSNAGRVLNYASTSSAVHTKFKDTTTCSFDLPAMDLSGKYIFFQIQWWILVAGTNSGGDVNFYFGDYSASMFKTPPYTNHPITFKLIDGN